MMSRTVCAAGSVPLTSVELPVGECEVVLQARIVEAPLYSPYPLGDTVAVPASVPEGARRSRRSCGRRGRSPSATRRRVHADPAPRWRERIAAALARRERFGEDEAGVDLQGLAGGAVQAEVVGLRSEPGGSIWCCPWAKQERVVTGARCWCWRGTATRALSGRW